MITSTSLSRIRSTTSPNSLGSRQPLPVSGSRTWQWATVAPAFAASIAAVAICSGVTGMAGCLSTVSPAPVTAHVTMTVRFITTPPSAWHSVPLKIAYCSTANMAKT